LAAGVLMAAIPPRARRARVFLFDGGIVRVSNLGRRLVVLPWADLDTLSVRVVSGYDEDYVAGCVLRGRSGATLTLGRKGDTFYGKEAIIAAAEREIASRRLGPLTHLLDTGQPVVIGSLTVDQLGVSARGRWHVSWQQARQVNIRLHGQRVLIKVGRLSTKRAALDGLPNSFLARYVIEHAARRAGVPVNVE
jgi:hypothetical protein